MDNHYMCPHCRGHLRVGDYIVFKIRNKQREKGLLLLHPEVGNYASIIHPQFNLQEGDRLDFFCPLCLHHLDAALNENLVHVIMIDRDLNEHDICFSRIAGEQSSFKVSEQCARKTCVHSYNYTHLEMTNELV